jgi:hypothetical protein
MKDTIKRAFSRPIQMSCNVVVAISAAYLLPDSATTMQWLAYIFIWVSLLFYGLDNYKEGFDRGLNFMNALEGKP